MLALILLAGAQALEAVSQARHGHARAGTPAAVLLELRAVPGMRVALAPCARRPDTRSARDGLVKPLLEPQATPPPGLVLIPGGRTQIGIDTRELAHMLDNDPAAQNYAASLSAETPRHEEFVADFYLMSTEVTNEQFAEHVRRANARPPEHWGEAAIRAGLDAHFEEEERLRAEALRRGEPAPTPRSFDRRRFWLENWRTSRWTVPPGEERLPVVFVDFEQARGYARWAGLRLMTEVEFQRAVRGDTTRAFPWGSEWDSEKRAATSAARKKGGAHPVASFPAGMSRQGVFDLCGNVWEWTASPYLPFRGYERRVYEFGFGGSKRIVNALADWNAEQRVVVGGSFQTPPLMARGSVRRGAERHQSTDALGFRCAASVKRGVDLATAVLATELTPNVRPLEPQGLVDFDADASTVLERWTSELVDGTPASHRAITGYAYALFTPVTAVPVADPQSLDRRTLESGPVTLGFLATSEMLLDPSLPAGTYIVAYRARGKLPETTPRSTSRSGQPPLEERLAFDLERDHVIFFALDGTPLGAQPVRMEWVNERASSVSLELSGASDAGRTRSIRFDLWIACRTTQKGFALSLPVSVPAGVLTGDETQAPK